MDRKDPIESTPTESDFTIVSIIPLAWGDMDSFSHVNNARYFTFFETARIHYFEKIGFSKANADETIGPILASTNCRFIFPLTYPDTIKSCVKIVDLKTTSFIMEHAIFSSDGRLAATGGGVGVCFNYETNQKTPIPDHLRKSIEEMEGRKFQIPK